MGRGDGFATREARHPAGRTGEQEQGRDQAPRRAVSAGLKPHGHRRGEIHMRGSAPPLRHSAPRRFNSSRLRDPAPAMGA